MLVLYVLDHQCTESHSIFMATWLQSWSVTLVLYETYVESNKNTQKYLLLSLHAEGTYSTASHLALQRTALGFSHVTGAH